ncbi:translation initiation factor IF-2 [Desulfotalea psychrophila]|uniref:Translation initiation factor IF-2 n=1 Tax=Desulfotalea psychrophila (strain LSv54 / DSM 12343) TaxID=177439 RepID=IF2_DESPS|nr:translation initiation factor IF-2 [Desulfotalea psychrophila]Q6AJY4.1 RecName: Full=Translation initiation factor IF-2 [Desulfotalea psychrophila LSv54]CAG37342.1 probable translation initiation factor IF-2 [Desulfotalea psychrophila LSv54]
MSRIRIYELAKEAGMSGKAFADKLIKKGYQIKGHSSTVDDATADEIRRTFLGTKESGQDTGQATNEAAAAHRPTTVIGGKKVDEPVVPEKIVEEVQAVSVEVPKEVVAEEVKKSEPVKAEKSEPVIQEVAPVVEELVTNKEAPTAPLEREEESQLKAQKPTIEKEESAAVAKPEVVSAGSNEKKAGAPEIKRAEHTETVEKSKTAVDSKKVATPASTDKKVKPAQQPYRSGGVRVIGRVELPIQREEPSRPRRKPTRPPVNRSPRPSTPSPNRSAGGPPKPAAPATPAQDDSRNRKKKGRRDEKPAERDSRPKAKGKKGVKFTHFGTDYQNRGRRPRRGKRDAQTLPPSEMKASKKHVKVYDTITVGDLAGRMKVKASDVIGKLMGLGLMATINQSVDIDTATLIATEYGYEVDQGITDELGIQLLTEAEEGGIEVGRCPVVTVMGHVDHGKTSILDAIRKTDVADGEAGGITQHIGAYHVKAASGDVTFVDTPGHAAFTEMRSRGAQVTDIVILVVAADDGVMDQTREAIRHSQAANVPIIVAVNKIDKDNADVERVKRELAELDLSPEEWGGTTMYCETSAKQQIGIDELMESVQLAAEMLELKANPDRKVIGRVLEAQLDKGRGPVATILVQAGTLAKGDHFVVGQHSGKVRAMLDYRGRSLAEAGPSIPVEVQGLSGVPSAGDEFVVVTDEKMAKAVSHDRAMKAREAELGASTKISLDKLFEQMSEGEVRELRVVLRADVQGTLEAFAKAAADLSTKAIKVRLLHEGTGTITDSDILLASASDAIIIGFNVRPSAKVKALADKEHVDVRSYDVIYHALDDIRDAMVGMLDPTFEEEIIGDAEVRDIFSVPKIGVIGGCYVTSGKIQRNAGVRVLREGVVLYTGKIGSLRRFKDDAKEVASGYECGIGVENFNNIKIGDVLEAFIMNEVAATLGE